MGEDEILRVSGAWTQGSVLWLTMSTQSLDLDSIRSHQWHILRCSAMTGTNLQEGLAWVVQDAKKRLFLY